MLQNMSMAFVSCGLFPLYYAHMGTVMTTLRRRPDGVMVRTVGQELLLLDTENNQVHQLNETATFIWQRCDETPSAEDLAHLIAAEYSVDAQVAKEDAVEVLRKLQELKLLVEM
jgi:Coenzyme PQQ synthesis protein D (PqqD)